MQWRTRTRVFLPALLVGAVAAGSRAAPSARTSPSLVASALGDDRIPDRIELNSGAKLEGRIVYEDASKLLLLTGSGEKSYDKKTVKTSRSRARLHGDLFERWLSLDAEAIGPILDLARAAKQTDLLEDAACFASHVILLDPANEDAHRLLGHRKRGSTWDLEFRKDRWVSFEKILPSRPDWDDGSDLSSAHYIVRTNLSLRAAVDAALDLECFYRAFFELFGAELELREVVDPMTVEIHGDKRSFPAIATGRTAYTDAVRNWVELDASASAGSAGTAGTSASSGSEGASGSSGSSSSAPAGSAPEPLAHELFHEATHQLVAAVTRFSHSGAGTVPGWLGEGLAEYMAGGISGPPGQRKFIDGSLLLGHFAVHASAKSPYDLSRVLTFEADDFVASSKSDLKYAQAYTLVQFCMDGEGGKYRKGFLDFLRAVWRGKAASADFRKAMKMSEGAFEKAWVAHVRGHAR